MLWEVEIRPLGRDSERERVCDEFDLLANAKRGCDLVKASARGFLLEGEVEREAAEQLASDLLVDSVVESATISEVGKRFEDHAITVLLKPGVMDPVAESVLIASADLGVPLQAVRTFRRYFGTGELNSIDRDLLFRKVLANDAIEQIVTRALHAEHLSHGKPYVFRKLTVPLLSLDDDGLVKLSREGSRSTPAPACTITPRTALYTSVCIVSSLRTIAGVLQRSTPSSMSIFKARNWSSICQRRR